MRTALFFPADPLTISFPAFQDPLRFCPSDSCSIKRFSVLLLLFQRLAHAEIRPSVFPLLSVSLSAFQFSVFQIFSLRADKTRGSETSATGPSDAWGHC